MTEPFFDRELELQDLERAWASRGAALVTLWGRRRVGKSTLLAHFAAGKRSVYLYGTRMNERDILTGLALQAADAFDDAYLRAAPFPTWDAALDYLADRAITERLLLVLDEFPYLCEVTQGLDTLVQRWWDRIQRSSRIMVVLSGSGFSFIEGLTGAQGALHGRRTAQLAVHPFDYLDAARFFPHLSPEDKVRAYACFGGVPAYLRYWTDDQTLPTHVQQTILSAGHVLFREAEELLRTEFHQETLYASILRAVAIGEERPSDIARAVGRHSADELSEFSIGSPIRICASGSGSSLPTSLFCSWAKPRRCGSERSRPFWTSSLPGAPGRKSASSICGAGSERTTSTPSSASSDAGGMARTRSISWVFGAVSRWWSGSASGAPLPSIWGCLRRSRARPPSS